MHIYKKHPQGCSACRQSLGEKRIREFFGGEAGFAEIQRRDSCEFLIDYTMLSMISYTHILNRCRWIRCQDHIPGSDSAT